MELQRYLLKDKGNGAPFGGCVVISQCSGGDYEWYFGKDMIGVKSNYTTEAEYFIKGFLAMDDVLIIDPTKEFPNIRRKNNYPGCVSGADKREIHALIQLIVEHPTTHAYLSSASRKGIIPNILTFSLQSPPEKLYNLGEVMPIKIRAPTEDLL